MLSGNGRHRRPRQAPALLVAAGVTGSAIAIPLLAASGASAADGTVWDRVAECESGGSWSADTGNGEYGGLSLTQADWEAYGGLSYAPSADQASRNQQIAVAQKVLADQGVGAWGTCGLTSGLTQQNGALGVDTGVAGDASQAPLPGGLSDSSKETTGSTGSGDSSDSSGSASSTPAGSTGATPSDSASSDPSSPASSVPSDKSMTPGKSTGAGAGDVAAQTPGGSPTGSPYADDTDKSEQSAGSWSLVDTGAAADTTDSAPAAATGTGKHRGGSAEESPAEDGTSTASAGRHASPAGEGYLVHAGDSLESIADSLHLAGGWRALYEANKDVIGADPSSIVPGQTLSLGAE
ncbi:transglycosylase family protein [Streptomyces galbus]|uniref:LysM peptidoglycan-binding domain-containing protein n=1 Tax=Streptomyces galbus TaxID=33898 RepID=A0A4U5WX60_STRGB|nr:transglycosylase family protein [Streptomyces galbus]TKT07148.1 LysM peptidoglycan-binding domain-containing protein [Streptomyces galbus]GHD34245.1 peptidoglycan-binding protein LysM [Streptomyces galbus]